MEICSTPHTLLVYDLIGPILEDQRLSNLLISTEIDFSDELAGKISNTNFIDAFYYIRNLYIIELTKKGLDVQIYGNSYKIIIIPTTSIDRFISIDGKYYLIRITV